MSIEASFLFVVVSGNNTEKNREAYEQRIKDARRWLGEIDGRASEVTKQQLAKLHTLEQLFQESKTKTDSTGLISKATDRSDLPETLQPKNEEINGYLRKLKAKRDEVDEVLKETEEQVSYLF